MNPGHPLLTSKPGSLKRELGVFGATMMGLGAMIGTGIFVSIGIAAGISGPSVILAIAISALVAICNALSSAQLAARYPVSGGTYEYGYERLTPAFGFTAGWMFLCAKSASAATAALGFSGYLLSLFGWSGSVPVFLPAAGIAVLMTALVMAGIRRSNLANIVIVSLTLTALVVFMVGALPTAISAGAGNLTPFFPPGEGSVEAFLRSCALMFVAYTGYARIATLGEEVKDPERTIPRAIVAVMVVAAILYIGVGITATGAYGAEPLGEVTDRQAAPLQTVMRELGRPNLARVVAAGAITAMLGVLLNLILGLSRMVLAMARRGDLPARLAELNPVSTTPTAAVAGVGILVASLALIGEIRLTWSFSAFTVLIYYAITNLAALRLSKEDRRYPPFIPMAGLASCLFLAFWIEPEVWATGLAVLGLGLGWHLLRRRGASDPVQRGRFGGNGG